jgi:hypothetical protein
VAPIRGESIIKQVKKTAYPSGSHSADNHS